LREKTPKGERDENVFDIMPGMSVVFLIKSLAKKSEETAKLFYFDVFGSCAEKYTFLSQTTATS
jgi:hypothetical protein